MSVTRSTFIPTRRLPEHPSLEQLRKQAKELLRDYCSGVPVAVDEINQFERRADAAAFSLNDAQRVLARAYGFASWPKLKAFVTGDNIARFIGAAKSGDVPLVRSLLASRPELIGMDTSANDEHRALHYAVMRRDLAMVRLLMEAGADARKGIFPHRDATSAFALARDRDYNDIVAVMEEEERRRREEMSCINATVSPVQDQISAAIVHGDQATAMRLLEADRSLIQACDRDGATPLHIAAQEHSVALATWLLERRANIHKEDSNGLTPLDRAALAVDPRNNNSEEFPGMAALLLERGARLTVRGAVAMGDSVCVRELIQAEPGLLREINSRGGLLTLAVNHRQAEMTALLLDLGADVDERILLEELEEPTESWGMPLWHAALAGDLRITKLLLDRGADPNANVYASGWPLRNAWDHKDDSVKKLLLERGAKLQPYMVAEAHDIEGAKRLLAEGEDEELASELAWSAADHGCPEIVALALPHLGWSADDARWHWILIQPIRGAGENSAANEGHFKSMNVLLQHGVDANVARFGQTALHFAAARRSGLSGEDRARFASMLIDYGARLDVRDDLLKSTALAWASRWGWKALVELLIERGAAVEEMDGEPWATPLAWARKMKHGEIAVLLENAISRHR